MNRRGFLRACLAAGIAPVIIKAGVLMPVRKIEVATLEETLALTEATLANMMLDTAYLTVQPRILWVPTQFATIAEAILHSTSHSTILVTNEPPTPHRLPLR